MKGLIAVLLCLLSILSVSPPLKGRDAADQQPAPDSAELPKFLQLTPKLGTGGQPTEEGLRQLAKQGYRAVINLRTPQEGVDFAAEAKLARELGLKYFNIPVVSSAPKEEQAIEFLNLTDTLKDDKVFIHCASANRVGCFVMIRRVLKDGVPPRKAAEEAGQIGLRSDVLRQFAEDFVERHKK
jgi:protein tyrosine phosphatase (PTP) superfamily phosphohydrolase (DUF442 family)